MEVNDEEGFEGKIYLLKDPEMFGLEIVKKQGLDLVIQRAIQQIRAFGKVRDGQLRKAAQHLRIERGALCFDDPMAAEPYKKWYGGMTSLF